MSHFSRMRGGAPRLGELLELFPLDLHRPVEAHSRGIIDVEVRDVMLEEVFLGLYERGGGSSSRVG